MQRIQLKPRGDLEFLFENKTALGVDRAGIVCPESRAGLFVDDTRVLSRYRYLANGAPPELIAGAAVDARSWFGYFAVPPYSEDPAHEGAPPQHVVELKVHRQLCNGFVEHLELRNFTQHPVQFCFAIEIDADFCDVSELDSGRRLFVPEVTRSARALNEDLFELRMHATAEHARGQEQVARMSRSACVRVHARGAHPQVEDGCIVWTVKLDARARCEATVEVSTQFEAHAEDAHEPGRGSDADGQSREAKRRLTRERMTTLSAPGDDTLTPLVLGALERASDDLLALRLFELDEGPSTWLPAAGVPLFLALFGRDTLTAAWQSALLTSDVMRGALPAIARYQGERDDPWRDERPGKMLHQARQSPLAQLQILPWDRNYASVTPSAFWPVTLSEAWHWTGDRELIGPLIEPALRALRWCDEHGDLDGDGFYEYTSRSSHAQKNHAWKDSDEAIVHADGSQAEDPMGTCEEQAYVYAAKLHMSELLWWFDRKDDARRLFREARELKERFNDFFWMPDERYFALGIDRHKRPIRSIASNPGHCLATGIVADSLVVPTAERMLSPELFSGWGVRTLSDAHPAYNPYAYQRGAVWPVEQGTFALGFMRYGLHEHVESLVRAQFEACALFEQLRLPECFGGQPRDEAHPFPCLYSRANWPQAWSSSALWCMVQALLGLYPYAPLHLLLIDPRLPTWLPEMTLHNLHVGDAVVSLRFVREASGRSRYEVLEQRGRLRVLRQESPWSLTAGMGRRAWDALSSLAH